MDWILAFGYVALLSGVIGAVIYKKYDRYRREIDALRRGDMSGGLLSGDRSRHDAASPAELTRAIEAIAIEVERISEGQRFVTKLLAERNTREQAFVSRSPVPAIVRKPITPTA